MQRLQLHSMIKANVKIAQKNSLQTISVFRTYTCMTQCSLIEREYYETRIEFVQYVTAMNHASH